MEKRKQFQDKSPMKNHVNVSKFRYHWIMCSHMPKRKHSTKNPINTEAVQWIAENAG
jgi:hypothetical protein